MHEPVLSGRPCLRAFVARIATHFVPAASDGQQGTVGCIRCEFCTATGSKLGPLTITHTHTILSCISNESETFTFAFVD